MKSKVYFAPVSDKDPMGLIKEKLFFLIDKSNILGFVSPGAGAVIKMHFGEEGNTGFVRPEYLRVICDCLLQKNAEPVLSDTNTLYRGRRTNSADHLSLAHEHGFTFGAVGANVFIPDDNHKDEFTDIDIGQALVKTARVARIFLTSEVLIGVAHFKGHIMTGFGGALKNIGMGCASRIGKLAQHCDVSPLVKTDDCIGCGKCVSVCPTNAITLENKKAVIANDKCIGCATCIAVCPKTAIDVNWNSGADTIQQKMIEYASSILKAKQGSSAFFNFATKITKECDCLAKDDPKISPDVGIFASHDPVSVDKAALDMVIDACGRDIFKEEHPERNGMVQLEYAQKIGLGSLEYDLIKLQ